MTSRLFHTIIVCGAALGAAGGCGAADDGSQETGAAGAQATDEDEGSDAVEGDPDPTNRCRLDDGRCNEHCPFLSTGECLDLCYVRSATCRSECLLEDGSCGWPPTK